MFPFLLWNGDSGCWNLHAVRSSTHKETASSNAQRGVGRADDSLASPPEDSLVPVGCHVSCQPPSFDLMTHCSVNPSLEVIKGPRKGGGQWCRGSRQMTTSLSPERRPSLLHPSGPAGLSPECSLTWWVASRMLCRSAGILERGTC